jgi:hypothetical protein
MYEPLDFGVVCSNKTQMITGKPLKIRGAIGDGILVRVFLTFICSYPPSMFYWSQLEPAWCQIFVTNITKSEGFYIPMPPIMVHHGAYSSQFGCMLGPKNGMPMIIILTYGSSWQIYPLPWNLMKFPKWSDFTGFFGESDLHYFTLSQSNISKLVTLW